MKYRIVLMNETVIEVKGLEPSLDYLIVRKEDVTYDPWHYFDEGVVAIHIPRSAVLMIKEVEGDE